MQKRKQSSPLKQSSKAKVRILPLLDNNCNIAPCKGIQDSLELWTPGIGFRIIQGLDSGFRALDSGFQEHRPLQRNPRQSWVMDSRDWIPDHPGFGFRIPGIGFRIPGIGFRIPGIGFRIPVLDSGFQVLDSGFQVLDYGFQGLDSGFVVSATWIVDSNH